MLHYTILHYHKLEDTLSLAKNAIAKYYNKVKRKTTFPLSENLSNTGQQAHLWPLSLNGQKIPTRKLVISFPSFLSISQSNKIWSKSSEQPGAFSDLYPGPQIPLTSVFNLNRLRAGREGNQNTRWT